MSWHILKRGFLSLALVAGLCFLIIFPAYSATYYVRPDGGTATQCTGLVDAPYPGSGSNRSCAFSHPFWAIGPVGNNPTRMAGGDTLIIDGSNNAQYMMGWGAPNIQDTTVCYPNWPWGCYMRSVPSGPDAGQPTRILGKGWNNGCPNPPQLWATERAGRVLNLAGSSNVEIQCLEVTDHSACQEHGPNACNRNTIPYGPWGTSGLVASDSENVLIKDVNIHGMAYRGVYAGRLKDWTIENSKIVANSFVGWDGDIGANQSSNSGTITFTKTNIQFNGCGETYPDKKPYNCYSQDQGGYGDGLGTHLTGANWVFNNCDISHNVSDGLDLLYHSGVGTITIKRSKFEGNAGNQVKTGTNAVIENSILIGNCGYFHNNPITWKSSGFNNCRAGGNPLAAAFHAGTNVSIYNSTVTSNGDTMMQSAGSGCTGNETITSRNNIYLGGTEFNDGFDKSALYWAAGSTGNGDGPCGGVKFDDDYSVIWNTKNFSTDCNGKPHSLCKDPKFVESAAQYYTGEAYNVNLQSTSPAIGKALVLTGKSSLDYNNNERGTVWDIGALEYGIAQTQPTCADGIQYCTTQTACEGQSYFWYNNTCNAQAKPKTCADGIQYCATQTTCESQSYFWYNNTCNAQPKPKTCADGIQYCTTQTACEGQSYFWYNNTCNAQPKPLTCADGIQYCTTQTACEGQNYFWYNNTCNAQPKPKTCADGIQYCTTQTACEGQGYYWYNNTCNAQPKPLTCADGIQYCTTQTACEGQNYFWYNNTCNVQPKPKACTDGIQYCTTQTACEGQGYYWYNSTCNAQAQLVPTCTDGAQYCKNKPQCTNQGYYWYNNTCNAQPKPKTCADGIQYCTTQTACEGQSYFWYNNTCNAQAKPKTCADGIQYCLTQADCSGQGYYWYNNGCHVDPKSEPQSQHVPQPKPDEVLIEPTTPTTDVSEEPGAAEGKPSNEGKPAGKKEPSQETAGSNAAETPGSGSVELASTGETTTGVPEKSGSAKGELSDEGKPADKKEPSEKGKPSDKGDSGSVSGKVPAAGGDESRSAGTESSGKGGRGGGGGGGGGKSSGGSGGSGTSLIGGGGAGIPTNTFGAPSPVKSTGLPGQLSSNLIKGAPQAKPSQSAKRAIPTTAPQSTKGKPLTATPQPAKEVVPTTTVRPAAANKTDSTLITPSLHLTDTTSISLNRDDLATQAEVAPEPTVEPGENQPDENVNLTKTEGETPLNKTITRITDLWRKMLRWFSGE